MPTPSEERFGAARVVEDGDAARLDVYESTAPAAFRLVSVYLDDEQLDRLAAQLERIRHGRRRKAERP